LSSDSLLKYFLFFTAGLVIGIALVIGNLHEEIEAGKHHLKMKEACNASLTKVQEKGLFNGAGEHCVVIYTHDGTTLK